MRRGGEVKDLGSNISVTLEVDRLYFAYKSIIHTYQYVDQINAKALFHLFQ